ncbi:LacI family DNA-binding transcriptional regulator [Alicyclobacillus kakegawensis]|uniref:LacI family DNA-binding transcriptional regulator n=1 Tax=Alicyclobacillus kakegawensis TaxID=392012 RepID=UPI000A578DDC|nr:LacI family DNA-binding transcriptional regulator [Alicyclobacillus kakegawensis]
MSRKATIKDIAKIVGVTPATVSNVLNGNNRFSEDTKKRILAAAKQLNYTPNMFARALVKNRSYTIGLFIPASPRAFLDPYFSELLRGLTEIALEHGYVVSIIYADGLNETVRNRIDGLVLTEVKVKDEYVSFFQRANVPFVSLARGAENELEDYVVSDTRRGLEEAIKYLARLGHRRIGYALGPLAYEYVYERYSIFRDIQRKMGLICEATDVGTGENSRQGGRMAARRIMRAASEKPTAILASTDVMALGVIEYLQSIGMSVPEDVSVVGFDDAPFSRYVTPPIATVRHDIYQLGRHAASMLISKLEGRDYTKPIILPVKFIVRGSISSPR